MKYGEIVAERYNYGRTPAMRMLSNSMAKTITALAVLAALEDGLLKSLDDTAETYAPQIKGTLYGGTRLVDLRFNGTARRVGIAQRGFNATLRDYARLGMMMAADGRVNGVAVV